MVGEVISEQFQPQSLLDMSNMKLPSEAQLQQQAAMAASAAAQRPVALPGFQGNGQQPDAPMAPAGAPPPQAPQMPGPVPLGGQQPAGAPA